MSGHIYSRAGSGSDDREPLNSPGAQGQMEMQEVGSSEAPCMQASQVVADKVDHDAARRKIWLILAVMSAVFLVLNIFQIALIFRINSYYWTALLPAILLLGFMAYLGFEIRRMWSDLVPSWSNAPNWQTRAARVGIGLTVFLNIIACEFGYLNGEAVSVGQQKVWSTSLSVRESLPPPALALIQAVDRRYKAILASDENELNDLYTKKLSAAPTNQRSFTNWTYYPARAGSAEYPINYVTFNGSYHDLSISDDLDLSYLFYFESKNTSRPTLAYAVFDRAFLASPELFQAAYDCGVITTDLFPARGRSQLNIEQVNMNDNVNAIGRGQACNRPEFKHYATYRSVMVPLGEQDPDNSCDLIDAATPPASGQPRACTGDIDVQFSSMIVTNQTSGRRKDWIDMLTDEGGIVGGITFITWFLSILNQ